VKRHVRDGNEAIGNNRVVYSELHESRSAAQKREAQLNGWTRAEKSALIAAHHALLKTLSAAS
jgi:predicted GIY-YIG superfamily endonuclease